MYVDEKKLLKELRRLKKYISDLEEKGRKLKEEDVKDCLIAPLCKTLGWIFPVIQR